jgi:hypothetical protein
VPPSGVVTPRWCHTLQEWPALELARRATTRSIKYFFCNTTLFCKNKFFIDIDVGLKSSNYRVCHSSLTPFVESPGL